ncbi:hypothetical protein [Lysinibacillus xylanilyticus]|uniref:hypothetical protein n=1 Tax=Lysinibacillus xylanilyticus TaxID=582475 RepID=UPI003810AAB7
MFFSRERSAIQRHDVGHEDINIGRDGFSLRSSIANPQGVTQSPLQSTILHHIHFNKMPSPTFGDELFCL